LQKNEEAMMTIKWTEEMLVKLGSKSDTVLAKELGISKATVSKKRNAIGIPVFKAPKDYLKGRHRGRPVVHPEERYPGITDQLKTKTNIVVAEMYGLSRERIRQIREQLGIEKIPNVVINRLSDEDKEYLIENLGKVSDNALGNQLNVGAAVIGSFRRSIDKESFRSLQVKERRAALDSVKDRIGVDSDRSIAVSLGWPAHSGASYVQRYRIENNISANPERKTRWNRWDHGTLKVIESMIEDGMSVSEVSESIKMHKAYVYKLMRKHSIETPAHRRRRERELAREEEDFPYVVGGKG
tara:strand:+ start:884 stop:1777 length:894 start_codon:yes stop_codon:yes gene_type:complete